MTPAALISEIGLALDVALEPSLAPHDADTMAVKYTERVRHLLHQASLNHPHDTENEEAFKASMGVFLRWDSALFQENRDALGIQIIRPQQHGRPVPQPGAKSAPAQLGGSSVCLRFATTEAPECASGGRACAYSHVCPFCAGSQCNNRSGYLQYHLGRLRTPLQLVSKKAAQQLERPPRFAKQGRSRSRSRSTLRRRQWGHQRNGPQGVRPKEEDAEGAGRGQAQLRC